MDDRFSEEQSDLKNNPSEQDSEQNTETNSEEEVVSLSAKEDPGEPEMKPKKKTSRKSEGVPLRAFVASLLAVLLVCGLFTVAIASDMRRLGYTEGIASIFGDLPSDTTGAQSGTPGGTTAPGNDLYADFSELEFLDKFFKAYSYNDLSDKDFLTAVLKAYVDATGDLYAEYYTQEEFDAMNAENAGEGVGIGVSVIQTVVSYGGFEYDAMEIITAFPDSPAYHAGVQPGDIVFFLGVGEDRKTVDALGYTEALNRMRGEKGSEAVFTVLRPNDAGGYDEKEFRIIRDEYTMQSVEYKVSVSDPTVGIVRILQFDLTTPTQFKHAMDALISKGIASFVFDVRNNPGGDLKSICAVLSYFLEENDIIISAEDRTGKTEAQYAVPSNYSGDYAGCSVKKSEIGMYRGLKMTVLANKNTASAAELFTATMRDYDLAVIVGQTTYGKGSMQSIYPLAYFGYEGAVKLTTRHYFPPCGIGYDGIGITPDVEVALSEEAANTNIYKLAEADDAQLQAALSELKK